MKIRLCNLENFRNIEAASLSFAGNRVFLHGLNGQGKSNLLEALGLLHAVRSFRTADLRPLVRKGQPRTRVYYEVENGSGRDEKILIDVKRAGGRDVSVNGEKCPSLGDFLARFPCMVLAADDITVVRGSPALRRRLLDLHFSSSRPGYYDALRQYYRGLAARNRLLKKEAPSELIRAHDHPLSEVAARVVSHRQEGTADLAPRFEQAFSRISGGLDEPGLHLRSSSEASEAGEIRALWEKGKERDRFLGSTQSGPHRDDWLFQTESGDARDFASDGQQRNLAVALKLTLFQDLQERTGENPVLLADDVLGELDSRRKQAFWNCLPESCQIIATGTEFSAESHPGNWEVFEVRQGTFQKEQPS